MLRRFSNFIPLFWRIRIRNRKAKRILKNSHLSVEKVFGTIYAENKWGNTESVSGPGSQKAVAQFLIKPLNTWFDDLNVQTFLDLPCGDGNWIFELDLENRKYIGADIVPELIDQTRSKHATGNRRFEVLDIINDPLPPADLLLCRDCFVHLPNELILKALENISRSEVTYIALTHFPDFPRNYNIPTGHWRPVNLQLPPYNLPDPIAIIEEWWPEGTDERYRKVLALWRSDDLK